MGIEFLDGKICLCKYFFRHRRRKRVRGIVGVPFYDDSAAELDSVYRVALFGVRGVQGVRVVRREHKGVFYAGGIILSARGVKYLFQHGGKECRSRRRPSAAARFFGIETYRNADARALGACKRGKSGINAREIVYARRTDIFAVCAAFVRLGCRAGIKVEIDNLPVAESRKKGFGVAQDRGQVVLNGRRKTAVYVAL